MRVLQGVKWLLRTQFPSTYAYLATAYNEHIKRYGVVSYAQEGEDLIVREIFAAKNGGGGECTLDSRLESSIRDSSSGFYVDIGAHHPFRFSNTYALYKLGWSGINIDPMPKSMEKFRQFRPRDINLEIAIGASQDIKPYYIFEERALNTFDQNLAHDYMRASRLVNIVSIPCYPINAILARYASVPIDLLSIDVEGQDMAILSTLDFAAYAPRVVLAESFSQDLARDPLVVFMRTKGYNLLAKTTRTCIFVRART